MEELCRRVTGMTLQELYDERIRRPWGIDFFLGLPEDQEPRTARCSTTLTRPSRGWTRSASTG